MDYTAKRMNLAKRKAFASQVAHYVFPTALGLAVSSKVPPFNLKHYAVNPDGVISKGGNWQP